jgi:YHS domain-containing protein
MTKSILLWAALFLALPATAEGVRNIAEYNLNQGLALKGFDPVAVFSEGGGAATAGRAEFQLQHQGVTYQFASQANLDLFLQNPDRYEPTYGGWCAYAMASGAKVVIQPQLFTLNGNRAHYFVSSRAKQSFDRELASHEMRADQNWKQISGENPRL